MAKVMISIPDDLLAEIDSEAERRQVTRSGLLQKAARSEIGLGALSREQIVKSLDEISRRWTGSFDPVAEVRKDRLRER